MKLGRIIMFSALIGLLTALWIVFGRKESVNVAPQYAQQDVDGQGNRSSGRGDDPTYAEELRANTAVMEATRSRQDSIEKNIEEVRAASEKEKAELKEQISALEGQIKQMINASENALSGAASESAQAVRDEMAEQLKQFNAVVAGLQKNIEEKEKQSEAKIQQLEAALKAQKESGPVKSPSEEGVSPQPSTARRSVYASARLTTPYESRRTAEQQAQQSSSGSGTLSRFAEQWGMTAPQPWGPNTTNPNATTNTLAANGNNAPLVDRDRNAGGVLPQATTNDVSGGWETIFPVYTLPANTILADSRLLTPMIGRVPIGRNNVSDPYFFRVEVGRENLAANGHDIPGVDKMIVSGYAIGVREQQCARGYIDSLTFIFRDGRIVEQGQPSRSGSSNSNAIGWLSDPWGKPCIGGRYIDNASDYMKSRGAAAFIEAAAKGLSQSQVSYSQGSDGNVLAALDGNVWRFVLGEGISGTAKEYADYVRERTANAYDVIYVEQGTSVQIMLDRQIPIDYDATGRKVNYYSEPAKRRGYD